MLFRTVPLNLWAIRMLLKGCLTKETKKKSTLHNSLNFSRLIKIDDSDRETQVIYSEFIFYYMLIKNVGIEEVSYLLRGLCADDEAIA